MNRSKKPNLTQDDVNHLISDLLDKSFLEGDKRKLARGAVAEAAKKFKITEQNCQRIWRNALSIIYNLCQIPMKTQNSSSCLLLNPYY